METFVSVFSQNYGGFHGRCSECHGLNTTRLDKELLLVFWV